MAKFVSVWSLREHIFGSTSSLYFCIPLYFFCKNCAPALSIIQNGAVGRALPELIHRPQWSLSMTTTGRWGTPAANTALASTSLRCGSGRWCSRPPLLQSRLGWSLFQQSNLDLTHGKRRKKGREMVKKEWQQQEKDASPQRASLLQRGCGVIQGVRGVRADARIFSQACTDGLVFATLKRFC